MPLTAYVDESMRRRRGESVCFYMLAAVIVDDDELSDFHSALRALLVGKAKTIHWRYEPPKRQAVIAAALAALPVAAVVTVCLHGEVMPSERARRLSLGRLLRELKVEEVR